MNSPMPSTARKINGTQILRGLFGFVLLFWLFAKLPFQDLKEAMQESLHHWPWWIAALTTTFLGLTAGSVRWWVIIRSQGFHLSWITVFRLFFIGQFFNSFLPGGCGGDLVRAYYAARLCSKQKAEAASTVLVDRGIGLLTMMLFASIMVLTHLSIFLYSYYLRISAFLLLGMMAGVILLLILTLRVNLFNTFSLFQRLKQTKIGHVIQKAYDVVYYYKSHPLILFLCILLSLVNMTFLTLACYCFAQSLLIQRPVTDFFILFPVITILTAIPITPGALGIREGLFAQLFKGVGEPTFRTIPLSLLVYFGGLFWSLFGGILFIMQPKTARDEMTKINEKD